MTNTTDTFYTRLIKPFYSKFLIAFALLMPIAACQYKQVRYGYKHYVKAKETPKDFSGYKVYLKTPTGTYRLDSAVIKDSTLEAIPVYVGNNTLVDTIQNLKKKSDKIHKDEVSIITNKSIVDEYAIIQKNEASILVSDSKKSIELSSAVKASKNAENLNKKIRLNKNEIEEVKLYAVNQKGSVSSILSLITGILVLVLVILLVGALIYILSGSGKTTQKVVGRGGTQINPNGTGTKTSSSADSGDSSADSGNSSADSGVGSKGCGTGSDKSSDASGKSGCYIATMVYGSYDAPEVLVLRRFRDNVLQRSIAGRAFIKVYYRHSPGFVERFKYSTRINNACKAVLDKLVSFLS